VAHPSTRRQLHLMRIGTGLLIALLTVSTAHALDVDLEAYRGARRSGALGVVAGRIYAESRTPDGQPRGISPATVTLAPRSAALEARLRQLKEESRDSAGGFTTAVPAMRQAKERYERELLEAGAPDLAVLVAVDAEGRFRIPDVPAGTWLVLAWHSAPVDVSTPKGKPKERSLYQPRTRLQGYQSVTVWLQEVTVTGGGTVTLDLTDRNGWFRGVAEERVRDAGR
jgi:hypothetical protein